MDAQGGKKSKKDKQGAGGGVYRGDKIQSYPVTLFKKLRGLGAEHASGGENRKPKADNRKPKSFENRKPKIFEN